LIGGGCASLSAAYHLTLKGHACTIFDDHAELGGMMRYGILVSVRHVMFWMQNSTYY